MDDILMRKQKQEYEKLFGKHDGSSLVLIEGRPGSGKTTLTHKLARDWATKPNILKGAKMVFLVSLRILNSSMKDNSLSNILESFYNKEHAQAVTEMLEHSYGERVCFIVDGLDEYRNRGSIIFDLLEKRYLPKAMVIVASRPVGTAELRHSGFVTKRIEVLGFSREQISNYINTHEFKAGKAAEVEAYLNSHINVLHMCYLPVHVAMICYIYSQRNEVPDTETKIYELFTLLTIKRKLESDGKKVKLHSLYKLDELINKTFINICKLALHMTVNSKQTMLQSETDICLSDGSGHDVYSFGLVTVDSTAKLFDFEDLYAFLHLTFQEFLAGVYIASQNEDEQLKIVKDHYNKKEMLMVWKFYCGIVKFNNPKNISLQLIMSSNSMNDIHRIQCAFECQQRSVCSCILQDKNTDILTFTNYTFSPTDFNALNYVISSVDSLTTLVLDSCVISEITFSSGSTNDIELLRFCNNSDIQQFKLLSLWLVKFHSLETLDISHQILRNDGIIALTRNLSSGLKCCVNLKNLILSSNGISDSGMNELEEGLYYCINLKLLDLHDNNIGEGGAAILARWLRCVNLKNLILSSNGISDSGMNELEEGLYYCINLKLLDLHDNNIGKGGAAILARWLRCCTILLPQDIFTGLRKETNDFVLKELNQKRPECKSLISALLVLDLQNNKIGTKGAAALAYGVKCCFKLQSLNLASNKIHGDGAQALAMGLENCYSLKTLNLDCNDFSVVPKGCINLETLSLRQNNISTSTENIVDELKCCRNLQYLNLGDNYIYSTGGEALGLALQYWKHLRELNIGNSYMGQCIEQVAEGLQCCDELQILRVQNINIWNEDPVVLFKGIRNCKNLKILELDRNQINESAVIALVDLVKSCTDIQTLNLRGTKLDDHCASILFDGLKSCTTLQSLNICKNPIKDYKFLSDKLPHCTVLH